MFLDLEIRVLVCKKDVEMCLNMVNSLRTYDEFKTIPIFFHSDGSLDTESIHSLTQLENVSIVEKDYADNNIIKYIQHHIFSQKYRLENNRLSLWHKIKLFDFYFLSKSKNILCIDSDILFLNKPDVMIHLIETSTPFYFPDFQNSYSFRKNTNINVLNNVNTGLFYIPSEKYYDVISIENALTDLYKNGIFNTPQWIEQSAYAHMFYENGCYTMLDETKYKIPTEYIPISNDIECLHFVGHPPIRKMYNGFLKKEYL